MSDEYTFHSDGVVHEVNGKWIVAVTEDGRRYTAKANVGDADEVFGSLKYVASATQRYSTRGEALVAALKAGRFGVILSEEDNADTSVKQYFKALGDAIQKRAAEDAKEREEYAELLRQRGVSRKEIERRLTEETP